MIINIAHINRLLEALQAEPSIRYVAIDQGQCDADMLSARHPAIIPPAVLIAPRGEESIDADKWGTRYRLSIDLRLFYDTSRIANIKAPDAHREDYNRLLTLLQAVETAAVKAGFRYRGWRFASREESLSEYIIEIIYNGRNSDGD